MKRPPTRFPIIGIGASAGGVKALETFFRAIPHDCPMAFVVIMHLAPNPASQLTEILSRCTHLPVLPATDRMLVKPQHVYVLPPAAVLTIRHGRLHLAKPAEPRWKSRPIDAFLASLAEDQEDLAVGILLSGTGSDGAAGFGAVKRHGGVTLVQGRDETGPKFDAMPRAAQEIGVVDLVVPISRMPATLIRLARDLEQLPVDMPETSIDTIYKILNQRTGHDFSQYKQPTFLRRVQRRVQLHHIQTLPKYIQRLRRDPLEAMALFRDILIGVTGFFRDTEAFQVLREKVIPRLFEGKGKNDDVRVWVPACASGEEAYSIAILLLEYMDTLTQAPRVQLFATDIEENALAIARAAKYTATAVTGLSPERIKRFFVPASDGFRIARQVRDICVFSTQSAIKDPPFSRLDLVSCRNLMIYLSPELQSELIRTFHYAISPGGFLFLGNSENLTRHEGLFTAIDKKHRIFQRHDIVYPSPVPWSTALFRYGGGVNEERASDQGALPMRERLTRSAAGAVMDHFAPPYVVVESDGGIIEFSSRTGPYLETPAGPPSRNIFAMARRELKAELRVRLRKAKETQQRSQGDWITVRANGVNKSVRITIEPLHENDRAFFLVVFSETDGPAGQIKSGPARPRRNGDHELAMQQLELELKETREQLQSMIEELETANEELRSSNEELLSMNEELQSTNEELQTSKEELQSVNKERESVNLELNQKIEQLDQANSDLKNIFDGTRIATIFIDRHLIIRTFTPAVAGIFNLIHADQGRPLTDIAHRLQYDNLKEDVYKVLKRSESVERRVTTLDGAAHYLLRILPYRTVGSQIDGAVLTLIDITHLVEAEKHQRLLTHELSHRVKNTLAVVLSIANQTLKRSSDPRQFSEAFQRRLQALAVTNDFLSQSSWDKASLAGVMRAILAPHTGATDHRLKLTGPEVSLTPRAAVTLGMAIDELATNASKYGALSNATGRVVIEWQAKGRPGAQSLEIHWRERCGPAVRNAKPVTGLGTMLLTRSISYEMQGTVKLKFAKKGVECCITIPVDPKLLSIVADGNKAETATRKPASAKSDDRRAPSSRRPRQKP